MFACFRFQPWLFPFCDAKVRLIFKLASVFIKNF